MVLLAASIRRAVPPRPRAGSGDGGSRTRSSSVQTRRSAGRASSPGADLVHCAGGIRTHGLELMRLAGTAGSPTALSGRLESNQRSPVPETGGVATLPHGQLSTESTTVESNHARPPYQSGASPIGLSSVLRCHLVGSCSRTNTGVARELHPAPRGHGPGARSLALRRSALGGNRTRPCEQTEAPSGIRTRVAGSRGRHPRSARRPGRGENRPVRDASRPMGPPGGTRPRSSLSGRRGSRTPKAREPTRFRDGIPRRWQSFPESSRASAPRRGRALPWHKSGPGRGRTCASPVKSRELCQLSYGAVM